MAVTNYCSIYIGEEKRKAVITAIFDNAIVVEDEEGDAHQFNRKDIYPF